MLKIATLHRRDMQRFVGKSLRHGMLPNRNKPYFALSFQSAKKSLVQANIVLTLYSFFLYSGYLYVLRFSAINYFSRPVTLSWKYQNPDQDILSSNSPNNFKVDGNLEKKMLEFTSSKPLSTEDLRSMVYFQANVDVVPDLTINDQDKFYVTLSPYDEKLGRLPEISRMNLYQKGIKFIH